MPGYFSWDCTGTLHFSIVRVRYDTGIKHEVSLALSVSKLLQSTDTVSHDRLQVKECGIKGVLVSLDGLWVWG